MYKHHQNSIKIFLEKYSRNNEILSILLCGSIAHGYEREDSDIDIILIVKDKEYKRRVKENKLTFIDTESCTYNGGYIDCKVINRNFLKLVVKKGSDPARYAFKDAQILYSKIKLEKILKNITKFPLEKKEKRKQKFTAQLLAWKWFYLEAENKNNIYLKYLAIQKIVLFSIRLILNENEILYPFHKRMFDEIKKATKQPSNFIDDINRILTSSAISQINEFCSNLLDFLMIKESEINWPLQFMKDSELNWLYSEPSVDDL